MRIRKNILHKVLLLATLLCCFGQLVNTYAEAQLHKSIVCTNSGSPENCVNQHDDSLDDDQLEPNVSISPIVVSLANTFAVQQYDFLYHHTYINWQPPKI